MLDHGAAHDATFARDTEALSAWALESHGDPFCAAVTDLLVDLSPTDVPRVSTKLERDARVLTRREASIFASIDGHSTLEMMVEGLSRARSGEVLAVLCNLCARGVVVFERRR